MNAFAMPSEAPGDELVAVPDLAGTPAADAEGRFFGEVFGALADAGTGLIRYLDLDVHGADRHVLVPIGHVRVARTGERSHGVRLRAASVSDLSAIPPYEPHLGTPMDQVEREVLAAHSRVFSGAKYYAHPAYDHAGRFAGEHALRSTMASPAGADLVRLSELSRYEVAQEEQDVRGWPLVTGDGVGVGEVEDLVADPAALKVRYLLVRLPDEGSDRHVLLPVGFLQLDERGLRVRVPALQAGDVRALPRHSGPIRRSDEEELRAALDRVLDGRRRFDRPDFRTDPG